MRNVGTAFSDGLRIGPGPYTGYNGGYMGMSVPPLVYYEIDTQDQIIFSTAVISEGNVPLAGTRVSFNGINGLLDLGQCRGLSFDTVGGDLPNGFVLTISALDFWGHKVVEQVTIPSGATATPILTNKTYRYLKSIYASDGSGTFPILIKTSFFFGFPYYVTSASDVTVSWNNRPYYAIAIAGTGYQPLIPAASFLNPYNGDESVLIPGSQSTPSATSLDPRGGYHINPKSTADTPEASLNIQIYANGFETQIGTGLAPQALTPSQDNCYGVTQYSEGWQ